MVNMAGTKDSGAPSEAAASAAGVGPSDDQQSSSVPSVMQTPAPAVSGPLGQTLAVPILDPSELERIIGEDGKLLLSAQYSNSSVASGTETPVSPVGALAEGLDGAWTVDEEQQQQEQGFEAGESAPLGAESDLEAVGTEMSSAGDSGDDVGADQQGQVQQEQQPQQRQTQQEQQLKQQQLADDNEQVMMQRISENVLAVTVNQLIQAAEDALDQEPKNDMGVAEVDTAQLAADYLDELQVSRQGCYWAMHWVAFLGVDCVPFYGDYVGQLDRPAAAAGD